jgi:hypothetical protein
VIWVDGKQYRDADEFAREYLESPQQPEVEAQPESEDSMIRREQIEAFDRAHEPTVQAQEEAGTALAGKSWEDWKRAPFQ